MGVDAEKLLRSVSGVRGCAEQATVPVAVGLRHNVDREASLCLDRSSSPALRVGVGVRTAAVEERISELRENVRSSD